MAEAAGIEELKAQVLEWGTRASITERLDFLRAFFDCMSLESTKYVSSVVVSAKRTKQRKDRKHLSTNTTLDKVTPTQECPPKKRKVENLEENTYSNDNVLGNPSGRLINDYRHTQIDVIGIGNGADLITPLGISPVIKVEPRSEIEPVNPPNLLTDSGNRIFARRSRRVGSQPGELSRDHDCHNIKEEDCSPPNEYSGTGLGMESLRYY